MGPPTAVSNQVLEHHARPPRSPLHWLPPWSTNYNQQEIQLLFEVNRKASPSVVAIAMQWGDANSILPGGIQASLAGHSPSAGGPGRRGISSVAQAHAHQRRGGGVFQPDRTSALACTTTRKFARKAAIK